MRRLAMFLMLMGTATSTVAQVPVPPPAEQIAAAVLPLPQTLRAGAGVRGYTETLDLVTLREGTNTLVCTADHPGDDSFDVRCYDREFLTVIDRRRELGRLGMEPQAAEERLGQEVREGRLRLPVSPTAGYRMLGPIAAYAPPPTPSQRPSRSGNRFTFHTRPPASWDFPRNRRGRCLT